MVDPSSQYFDILSKFSEDEMDTIGEPAPNNCQYSQWDQSQQYSQPSSWAQLPNQYTVPTMAWGHQVKVAPQVTLPFKLQF